MPREITLLNKKCILSETYLGIGDLTWETNLGNQVLETCIDTFYYADEIDYIYCTHIIQINDKLRILDMNLVDKNKELVQY